MSGAGTKGAVMRGIARAWGLSAVLVGCVNLAGCVNLGGGKAPAMLIHLTPEASAAPGPSQSGAVGQTISVNRAILVIEPETDRSLAVTRVPVQVDDTRLAYLADVAWVERPARLFRGLLAEALRAKSSGLVLEDDQPAPSGIRRLSGRLLAMGYDARSRSVVVRYDALMQNTDGTLATRRFEAVEPNVKPRAAAVAPALNRAANDVADQVARWVAG